MMRLRSSTRMCDKGPLRDAPPQHRRSPSRLADGRRRSSHATWRGGVPSRQSRSGSENRGRTSAQPTAMWPIPNALASSAEPPSPGGRARRAALMAKAFESHSASAGRLGFVALVAPQISSRAGRRRGPDGSAPASASGPRRNSRPPPARASRYSHDDGRIDQHRPVPEHQRRDLAQRIVQHDRGVGFAHRRDLRTHSIFSARPSSCAATITFRTNGDRGDQCSFMLRPSRMVQAASRAFLSR